MANHAFISLWCEGYARSNMLDLFERLLATVPFSETRAGFTQLIIHPVRPSETPLIERDYRLHPLVATELTALAREHLHADSAFETLAHWDLWVWEADPQAALGSERMTWQHLPHPLVITCFGDEYDDGAAAAEGHFVVDLGFEHLFTGHAGLLGRAAAPAEAPRHPAEEAFLAAMADPANLSVYHQKTAANIQSLTDWLRRIREAAPVARDRVWSEGEENFEARLDEIVALR